MKEEKVKPGDTPEFEVSTESSSSLGMVPRRSKAVEREPLLASRCVVFIPLT